MTNDANAPAAFDLHVLKLCGLRGLRNEDAKDLLDELNNELELRLGTALTEDLAEEQIDEFEEILDLLENSEEAINDPGGAWLQRHVPNYRAVAEDIFERMVIELRDLAPRIAEACRVAYLEAEVSHEPIALRRGGVVSDTVGS